MAPESVPAAATAHHHTLDVPWSTPDLIDTITHATTQRIVPVATAGMAVSSGDNEERGCATIRGWKPDLLKFGKRGV